MGFTTAMAGSEQMKTIRYEVVHEIYNTDHFLHYTVYFVSSLKSNPTQSDYTIDGLLKSLQSLKARRL